MYFGFNSDSFFICLVEHISNISTGTFSGDNVEDYCPSGTEMDKALKAITLFDTIIFAAENNAQKTAKV